MSKQVKAGKKPLSKKSQTARINPDEVFLSPLKIPADVEADCKEKGWEVRWVDARRMVENGGQHRNGWMPYRRPKTSTTINEFKLGSDPDGVVRSTSLFLAYRPIEQGDKHRKFLKQRADLLAASFNKDQARELREKVSQSGLDVEVLDGFDENEAD